jgi:hypothetical protein
LQTTRVAEATSQLGHPLLDTTPTSKRKHTKGISPKKSNVIEAHNEGKQKNVENILRKDAPNSQRVFFGKKRKKIQMEKKGGGRTQGLYLKF